MREFQIYEDGRPIKVTVYEEGEQPPFDPESRDLAMPTRFIGGDSPGLDTPLPAHVEAVGLRDPITPRAVERAARLLNELRIARLRVQSQSQHLNFLRDLPPLRYLGVSLSLDLKDVSAVAAHAKTLQWLRLETGLRTVDVSPLSELHTLEQLYLYKGDKPMKGVEEALAGMPELAHLTLHSVTLGDMHSLCATPSLQSLVLKLGGNRDLSALPDIPALRFLEIWGTPGMKEFGPLGDCSRLEGLYLSQLPHARLPDLTGADSLNDVTLIDLPKLEGLHSVATAPKLRYLHVAGCKITATDVEVLRGHPTLEAAWIPLPRQKINRSAPHPVLGVPPLPAERAFTPYAGTMALPVEHGLTFNK